jgi:hypothetical protein
MESNNIKVLAIIKKTKQLRPEHYSKKQTKAVFV